MNSTSPAGLELANPATGEPLGQTPSGSPEEVDAAVQAAHNAFANWRSTPAADRVQYLFKLKALLEEHIDQLASLITIENGKTLAESRAELRRGIENVEVACGIPVLMQGYSLEDVAPGIDEIMVRQPLGVTAVITPFNFPLMIPLWFLPYAIATGNTVVLKPSDRVPFSAARLVELIQETGLPDGVVNLVNGGKPAVDALLDHSLVRAISFVGSTPVAKYVYTRGSASGKRVQCQGGAKNHVVVLPDADQETTTKIIADSAFGCAGQRCLAVSVTVTVGEATRLVPRLDLRGRFLTESGRWPQSRHPDGSGDYACKPRSCCLAHWSGCGSGRAAHRRRSQSGQWSRGLLRRAHRP